MNQDQVLSLVRAALLIAGSFLVSSGRFSASDWENISGAVLMLAPIIWSMFAHAPSKSTREMAGSTK